MKSALLIDLKGGRATVFLSPENAIEREVFAELQRRGLKFACEIEAEAASPQAPEPAAPALVAANKARRGSVVEMATEVLPDLPGVFDTRGLRDVLLRRYPNERGKIVTGIYPAVGRLIMLGQIRRVPGGFEVPAVVPTGTGETVASAGVSG